MATDTGFGMVRFFDDFLNDTVEAEVWNVASANSGTAFAVNTQVNGVMRGTVTNNSSNDLSVMYTGLIWEANDAGPLTFEARVKIETSLSQLVFAGLSDEATSERPMDYNGSTQTTTATNAVGFYYAGGVTSATWRCGGVKAGSDSTHTAADAKHNPVLATYQTLRVVVDAVGGASFYIDGDIVAENVSNCVTASTALMPYFSITDDGAAGSFDVDYCFVSKGRV